MAVNVYEDFDTESFIINNIKLIHFKDLKGLFLINFN